MQIKQHKDVCKFLMLGDCFRKYINKHSKISVEFVVIFPEKVNFWKYFSTISLLEKSLACNLAYYCIT